MTLMSIAAVSDSCGTSGSGSASTRRSNDPRPQLTTPVGAFLRTIFLRFAASSPALRSAASFSISHSGAITTTVPEVSYPARPARPEIWWNSRAESWRIFVPSYFESAVIITVRMGTLMPTPRVSVPQITRSSPRWASVSTSRR